jgi:hypothetical protein
MSRWMIDDLGNIRPARAAALAEILGVPCPVAEPDAQRLEDFGTLNVGLILVEIQPDGIRIKCRPAILSQRAVATLGYWLLDHPDGNIAITWFDKAWDMEHAPDARTAISFVSYLLELKRRTPLPPAERIRSQPSLQASRRWNQVKSRVSALTGAPHQNPDCAAILDPLFFGRWTILEVERATSTIEILARGQGYPLIDPMFARSGVRKTLETLADEGYRKWVESGFLEVATTGRARFDDVDAIIHWPRFGDLRTRYWRMAVPLRSSATSVLVLNASGNDSGIDLRPQLVEEPGEIKDRVIASHP